MDFIRKHWLGSAVLVMVLWVAFAIANNDAKSAWLPGILFWVFFLPWAFRGFVRFCGRAWRHDASKTP